MKAVRYSQFGPAHEVVELIDVAEPGAPGPGEVVIELEASPINPATLLQFEGRYGARPPALPVHAGSEGTGLISAVGEGVGHLKIGDRVQILFGASGNWRERILAKAARLFPLPQGADPLQLAMFGINPPTAWLMLNDFVKPEAGGWVIQNAANSGVGHNVIVLAKSLGLKTVNVVRRAELADELTALGADVVLVDGPDLAERVRAAIGDGVLKLAIDAVGGEATARLGASLNDGGTVVSYGLLSGEPFRLEAREIVFRNITLRGFWLQHWFNAAKPQEMQEVFGRLIGLIAQGVIKVPVAATYPLDRVRDALAHAARDARGGKVLVTGPAWKG